MNKKLLQIKSDVENRIDTFFNNVKKDFEDKDLVYLLDLNFTKEDTLGGRNTKYKMVIEGIIDEGVIEEIKFLVK